MASSNPALSVAERGEASPSPTADEVVGYAGTLESAIDDNSMFEPPPPLIWRRFDAWRIATRSRPASLRVNSGLTREQRIWQRVMLHYHGEGWREAAQALDEETWQNTLEEVAFSAHDLEDAREAEANAAESDRRQAADAASAPNLPGLTRADDLGSVAESEGSWRSLSMGELQHLL